MRGSEIDKGQSFFRNLDECHSKRDSWGAPQPWRHDAFPAPACFCISGNPAAGLLGVAGAGAGAKADMVACSAPNSFERKGGHRLRIAHPIDLSER